VRVSSTNWRLRGQHRQEGKGNTAGALLGSAIITGKSATMAPGKIVNVFWSLRLSQLASASDGHAGALKPALSSGDMKPFVG
jgi:hypothetical protein